MDEVLLLIVFAAEKNREQFPMVDLRISLHCPPQQEARLPDKNPKNITIYTKKGISTSKNIFSRIRVKE